MHQETPLDNGKIDLATICLVSTIYPKCSKSWHEGAFTSKAGPAAASSNTSDAPTAARPIASSLVTLVTFVMSQQEELPAGAGYYRESQVLLGTCHGA